MEIKLDLRNFKSFEDGHKVIFISILFFILGYIFNTIVKANYVPWNIICLEENKSLKQHS